MGTVYLARDVRLDRPVALKVLPEEFATQSSLRDRFVRETRTAASFSHPNIVPVYAVEEAEDFLAYAMAYVEGESLTERVNRSGPLGVRDTVRLLQDVGYALAYAHGRGIVHRDIKPDNIMIERATGRALVMDFGVARVISAPVATDAEGLTRVGEVVGTPEYMSPEQATGDVVDGRSDLYSLGLTAFFGVTGTPAISGDTTGRTLARQITEPLPPVRERRPDFPASLADAIARCAAKDPNERFLNAESLVEALDAAQLSAPEIPLSIRLLAQELGTLSLIWIGSALVLYLLVRVIADSADAGDLDAILPFVLLVSVLLTRFMQTLREVQRVTAAGYTAAEIHRWLRATVDERQTRRDELRGDPIVRRARRKTLIAAGVQVVAALVMARVSLLFRHLVRPGYYGVEPAGVVLVLSAMILFGVGVVLLLRSPVRAPIGERLFRLVWLGPIGRAFIRFGGRKARSRASTPRPVTAPAARAGPTSPPVAIPPAALPQLAALESRVAELEKWRREF
jgi:serine/threonine-protein kinase